MQATTGTTPEVPPPSYAQSRAGKLPEYVYQAAILLAVLLLLWTVV